MEPVAKRSSDRPYLSSNRKGIFQTKDYTTRSSIESEFLYFRILFNRFFTHTRSIVNNYL